MALKLGGVLKELRIHLCQTSKQSAGVREFIQKNYVGIKRDNPGFPILIRECTGIQPRVWARYASGSGSGAALVIVGSDGNDKGVERSTVLTNLSAGDVFSVVKQLAK